MPSPDPNRRSDRTRLSALVYDLFLACFSALSFNFSAFHWQLATEHWQLLLRFFRALRAVLRTALITARNSGSIQRSAHYVIPNSGQIFHTATADQHNRVLLQIVTDARDV